MLDAPAARCSVSAAVAEASVDDCVRTSARASALTVTENDALTALAEAVATMRAASLEVAIGRGENTPAPRSACSAPRSAVSRERMSARPARRALARSAERCRRSTGRRSIAISEVTMASVSIPDEMPVKLSPAMLRHARRSMPRSQSALSSASWCMTRVAGTVLTTSPVSASRKLATHTFATGSRPYRTSTAPCGDASAKSTEKALPLALGALPGVHGVRNRRESVDTVVQLGCRLCMHRNLLGGTATSVTGLMPVHSNS